MTRDEANYIAEPFIGIPAGESDLGEVLAEQLVEGGPIICLTVPDLEGVSARIRTLTEIAEQNALVSFPEAEDE